MEKKAYTLVLKGHIALSRAVFPKSTNGMALDTLARQFLWAEGLDYRHGTGHGVGSFLARPANEMIVFSANIYCRTFTRGQSELVQGLNMQKCLLLLGM